MLSKAYQIVIASNCLLASSPNAKSGETHYRHLGINGTPDDENGTSPDSVCVRLSISSMGKVVLCSHASGRAWVKI